jgi:hypothetical protein
LVNYCIPCKPGIYPKTQRVACYRSIKQASRRAMSVATGSIVGEILLDPSSRNPLLALQPAYSRSLVVQLLVLSAVCALHIVLMLHLLFTTRYHLPLSKVNYILLTGGCFISFIAILWQMLECALGGRNRSQEWPYMFDYLQYSFPGDHWSEAKKVWWLLLNALVVFLCHVSSPNNLSRTGLAVLPID